MLRFLAIKFGVFAVKGEIPMVSWSLSGGWLIRLFVALFVLYGGFSDDIAERLPIVRNNFFRVERSIKPATYTE